MGASDAELDVLVSEVGTRDGLPSVERAMPTAVKNRWIGALAAAGLPKGFEPAAARGG